MLYLRSAQRIHSHTQQAEIVETVLLVRVRCAVQVGAFAVNDVDFSGLTEESVALKGHVGYEFLGVGGKGHGLGVEFGVPKIWQRKVPYAYVNHKYIT